MTIVIEKELYNALVKDHEAMREFKKWADKQRPGWYYYQGCSISIIRSKK
jgi:hypothetical protein